MKTKTATKPQLIRRYHTLAHKLKLTDESKQGLLLAFGAQSSTELTIDELSELCQMLDNQLNNKLNVWRKRVMASIYGYLEMTGRASNPEYVKAIAVRSAGEYETFNKIPVARLQTVYYFYLDKQKVLKHTKGLVNEDLDIMQIQN